MEELREWSSSQDPRPTTMICASNYAEGSTFNIILGHILLVAFLIGTGWVAVRLFKKLDFFLVKERAPILALFQLIAFLMTLLIPYIVEIAISLGTRWPAAELDDVPFMRRLTKSTYMIFKTTCYMLFVPRVLVIYSNWKVPRKHKSYFWRIFGSEKTSLVVVQHLI